MSRLAQAPLLPPRGCPTFWTARTRRRAWRHAPTGSRAPAAQPRRRAQTLKARPAASTCSVCWSSTACRWAQFLAKALLINSFLIHD